MGEVAIRIENIGKRYTVGARPQLHRNIRAMFRGALSAGTTVKSHGVGTPEDNSLWALRDVSFEVATGEVVGVIGRNGSGKSTLLKILSRIVKPTTGAATIRGRVGSLLEVGAGFHPELTGRENIYLNGAVLGMRKREIDKQFDEIVEFAEIERFLDTPVKRYSSGMYMRLAFAVSAHLASDILLVDEVLAVGDAAFQQKCLGKMDQMSKGGRTVLFVSHNLGAVVQLCSRAVLLRAGRVAALGRSETVVAGYLSEDSGDLPDVSPDPSLNAGSPLVVTRCWVTTPGEEVTVRSVGVISGFEIRLEVFARCEILDADISLRVSNMLGAPLFTSNLSDVSRDTTRLRPGKHLFVVTIPGRFLAPDTYSLHVGLHRPNVEVFDAHDGILKFKIEEAGSEMWRFNGRQYGNILVQLPWRHEQREC